MADSLSSLDDGAVKYLIDNQLEPTVQNIYFARHSASAGYMPAEQQDISSFLPQVKNVIASAGLEVNDDTIATSKWMLENDIPLTKENLTYAQALRQTELTTSAENVAALAAEAVSEGKSAQDAVILSGYTWMEQAQNAVDTVENATDEDLVYIVEKGLPLTLDSLRKLRQTGYQKAQYRMRTEIIHKRAAASDCTQAVRGDPSCHDCRSKLPFVKTGYFH